MIPTQAEATLTRESVRQSAHRARTQRAKLIVFGFSHPDPAHEPIYLGTRIEQVYKILGQTAIYGTNQTIAGIAHLDGREIMIIDLYRKIFGVETAQTQYVMVFQIGREQLIGLPLSEAPLLVEVSPEEIRPLPPGYTQIDTLEMATHIAVVPSETGESLSVFLLDAAHVNLTR